MKTECPLCQHQECSKMCPEKDSRFYWHCRHCQLIFTDSQFFPNTTDELERYKTHNNNYDDTGYVQFLERIIKPALIYLNKGMTGLDYGCGPSPVLADLVTKAGINCGYYDPFFFPDIDRNQRYDFVFCTETVEHFHKPVVELKKIKQLLNPNAYLFMMTEKWTDIKRFDTWYYKRDVTHTSFFHEKSMDFIAELFEWEKLDFDKRINIFKQRGNSSIANEW